MKISAKIAVFFGILLLTLSLGAQIIAIPVGDGIGVSQAPPASLPVSSVAALKSYASELVSGGQISVSSQSMLPGGTTYSHLYWSGEYPTLRGADKVMGWLGSKSLDFEVANTNDPIYLNGYLWDDEGNTYFQGYRITSITSQSGVRSLQNSRIEMELVYEVPIRIPGLQSAKIVVRDSLGNVIRDEYLTVRDGKLYFPLDYTDRKGELILGVVDSGGNLSGFAYDLGSGKQRYGNRVNANTSMAIKDSYFFKYYDGLPDVFQLNLGYISKDTLVVVDLVKSTDTSIQFNHDYIVLEGKGGGDSPIAFLFRKEGETTWSRVPWPAKNMGVSIGFGKRIKVHFIFESEPNQYRNLPVREWDGRG